MPSHYKGTKEQIRALSAFINLTRASDALVGHLNRQLGAKRLTISQFGVLEVLLHRGSLFQGDLAGKLLRSCGSITAVVAGLEKRHLVKRERSEKDTRFVRVELTRKGHILISGIFPDHAVEVTRLFQALTPREQEDLRRLCRKLGTSIASERT